MAVIHNAPGIKVNIDEIKQDLLTYLQRVENGETLIIMKTGKPMAEVRPIIVETKQVRPFGIVSSETESTSMVLVGHGTGADSVITEEPVMMSTQPSGMRERGRIMQIPGMGTGYEPKE